MTLKLAFAGESDDRRFANVSAVLHAKFDGWGELVTVSLARSPHGWVIVRATATIPGVVGATAEETSRVVSQDVRAVLEEAGEPIA